MSRKELLNPLFTLGVLLVFGGCAAPQFPHHSTLPKGAASPLDGVWQIQGNFKAKPLYRIEGGVMYVESGIAPRSFVKPGWVIAKGIKLKRFPIFSCEPISYKKGTTLWAFGDGEIEVLSPKHFILRLHPNARTGLQNSIEETFINVSLKDDVLLASRFQENADVSILPQQQLPPSVSIMHNQQLGGTLSTAGVGSRWAVVIGVADYVDTRIPSLRYASKDAKAFYDWAVSPTGGRFAPARVKLLLDKQSTGASIKGALFNWLGQTLEEDIVIIYFAGHGSPQSPDRPDNLFLLPYDCRYDNITTTGFPMWDIETALNRYIKAKRVVVVADACHSGGVGQSFDIARRANRGLKVNPISTGIQSLSKVGEGVCVISASDENQYSQESKDWGGGHGVFTYFLLRGLKGEADFNKDKSVTLGELTSYLSQEVRRATKNAQSPNVAGRYDPALTIGK